MHLWLWDNVHWLTDSQAPGVVHSRVGQGLSYRAQFCPVTITKIWTPYSQTNFFYQYTKKFLTSRAFHPCITPGVKENRKLVKKIFEVKKSPRNGTFCLPLFLVTQVYAVVTAKSAIGWYYSKLPIVFTCYLALKWAIGKSSGLSNRWVIGISLKRVAYRQKCWKMHIF